MPLLKAPNAEPIRGYRLIDHLGRGGFGEVWRCEAPGGIFKAIKFVYGDTKNVEGNSSDRAQEELRAVQHIKSIRHPFLLSIDRVESVQGELIIITELADQNLHELFQSYRAKGAMGVPRDELLQYLSEAAEVLDLMNIKFDLQHLDIKPRNLFCVSNHVKVADFGLVSTLSGGSGASSTKLQLGAITPVYAAPELFLSNVSRHCDQYSLAIVFQELLTGTLPFSGTNCRQLLMQHTQDAPDLSPLPPGDQPILAKALAKNPQDRYPSCIALVKALKGESEKRAAGSETMGFIELETESLRPAQNVPTLPAHVLPDYSILEWQGITPLQESWLVQSPKGQKRVLKILYGINTSDSKKVGELIARLNSAHHPAIISSEIVHQESGRLAMVADYAKESLRDRFQKCMYQKLPGIPRHDLVEFLRAAAEVLDYLYQQHGLQHLNLNPKQLVLDHGWMQIAEFGLAQLLWLPAGQDIAQRNSRYTAPELFERTLSRSCDQFSLAVIYVEMLTGKHPFAHLGNLAQKHQRVKPDLSMLPENERNVLGRALDPDPMKRWNSNTDMLLALEGSIADSSIIGEHAGRFKELINASRSTSSAENHPSSSKIDLAPNLQDLVNKIIAAAGGDTESEPSAPILTHENDVHTYKFQVSTPLGTARTKLESFFQQWPGKVQQNDEQIAIYVIPLEPTFWQRWRKQIPNLECRVALARVNAKSATPIEVLVQLKPALCHSNQLQKVEKELAPALFDDIYAKLKSCEEKRTQDRLLWPHTIKITPVDADGTAQDPIECRGKDLSHSGIGFFLPHELETAEVLVEIPNPYLPPSITIPATLVRAKPASDGWYEVGAMFRFPVVLSRMDIVCPPLE